MKQFYRSIKKAVAHDPKNVLYPLWYLRYYLSGIYLFNGNRIKTHCTSQIKCHKKYVQFGSFWYLWRSKGGIQLMENARLTFHGKVVLGDGVIIYLEPGATLEIGENTLINPNTTIMVKESVRIGSDCAISWDVLVTDADWHFFVDSCGRKRKDSAPVEIGDHVWIGARSAVLKGSRIESGAVIGAYSVVSGPVAAKAVVRGGMAEEVRRNVEWVKW